MLVICIQGEEDPGLGGGVREMARDQELKEVGDGVDATINGDAKLADREEEGSELGAEVAHDEGSYDTTPGGADADGVELEGVRGILV